LSVLNVHAHTHGIEGFMLGVVSVSAIAH
jgi:hypothetical protein